MIDQESRHDEEWRTGWKSHPDALAEEGRFRLVVDMLMECSPRLVFDLGCGDGIQTRFLKEAYPEVVVHGCDVSPAAVEKSNKWMDSVYVHDIDRSDLPEKDASYDTVLCIAVLEHLYDVPHALDEIYRILKPGGYSVIQVPNVSFWRFRLDSLLGRIPYVIRDPRHLQSFNKQLLVESLEGAGFSIMRFFGQRERLKKLADLAPSLFSEDIFVLARRTSGWQLS